MSKLYLCSAFCMILSIWAIVQLLVMGIFYFLEVTVLIEDVHSKKGEYEAGNYQDYLEKTQKNYFQTAVQCWIVAGIYMIALGLSCVGIQKSNKAEKKEAERREDDEYSCQPQGKLRR